MRIFPSSSSGSPRAPVGSDDGAASTRAAGAHPAGAFLERMLSGFGHVAQMPELDRPSRAQPAYNALRQSRPRPGVAYQLPERTLTVTVSADSPALAAMTDFRHVAAVTADAGATVGEARESMSAHRVRTLFVTNGTDTILGIVTSTDIEGEKPIQVALQCSMPHDEVAIGEIMTPTALLEALDLAEIEHARVGDIVETLRSCHRRHALVVETDAGLTDPARCVIRGMFSLTHIARLLGLLPQPEHDTARTFAEIESVIGP